MKYGDTDSKNGAFTTLRRTLNYYWGGVTDCQDLKITLRNESCVH